METRRGGQKACEAHHPSSLEMLKQVLMEQLMILQGGIVEKYDYMIRGMFMSTNTTITTKTEQINFTSSKRRINQSIPTTTTAIRQSKLKFSNRAKEQAQSINKFLHFSL
ncbi:hypothetical protein QVD17_08042 [Tagetes erecta]|uniref:Uncharacterized protein n=1 Tax=Tagetes erecta TaxID=13708 RepID=A0AAD8P4E1_TARER|nr:hypothetical protein QVD17_08042 [Tagetes erecta]